MHDTQLTEEIRELTPGWRSDRRRTLLKWVEWARSPGVASERSIISYRAYIRRLEPGLREWVLSQFTPKPITYSQSEKGRLYLLSKSLRLDGTRRKGCRLSDAELAIVRSVTRHEFTGVLPVGTGNGAHHVAVYTGYTDAGDWIEYTGVQYEALQVFDSYSVGVGNAIGSRA